MTCEDPQHFMGGWAGNDEVCSTPPNPFNVRTLLAILALAIAVGALLAQQLSAGG